MGKFNHYFLDTVKNKYVDFNGRATRSEYWYFVLFSVLISILLGLIDTFIINPYLCMTLEEAARGGLFTSFTLAVLLPHIGIAVRRLHDTGKSGWWYFIALIPIIGALILLFFFVADSQADENAYGANPKEI